MSRQQKTWWIVIFLSGILLAQLSGDAYMTDNPLSTYHLSNLVAQTQDQRELFVTILWERGKFFGLLSLLCASAFRRWMDKVVPVLLGLGLGIYSGVCLACQGFWGIGLFFCSMFPHGMVYLFVIYLILHKKKPVQYSGKRYMFTEIVSVLFIVIMILTGCCLETTVGSCLLKKYLQLLLGAV
jgi:hypothetical protein